MTAFVDLARPSDKTWASCFDVLTVIAGSLVLAMAAQLSIPLWFSPVPLTMQTFAVLLMGALLGPKRATAAVLAYLFEGAMGLPFFAAGTGGLAALAGPTGGYLVGFPLAAYVIGYLLERGWRFHVLKTAFAMTLGTVVIHLIGMTWLAQFLGLSVAFKVGVLPFLLVDLVKIVCAAASIPAAWKLLRS